MGLEQIRNIKAQALLPKEKKVYKIKRVSDKRAAQLEANKVAQSPNEDSLLENWFKSRRKHSMVGTCQCGCGNKSSMNDDVNFRSSCSHIFPKKTFLSIMYHPLNFVERAFWGGCHTNMDDRSMDLWVNFADWDDIKEKFYILAPLLTDEERATKFYTHLEKLVYENNK